MDGKERAGKKACEFVDKGMVVGLGSGSTAEYMIRHLGQREKEESLGLRCVATSKKSEKLAREYGLEVVDFKDVLSIDLTIDGADEVDDRLDGIKGGGGSLLYEKFVASVSDRVIWIVDERKLVKKLGEFPLPIEVVPFYHDKIFQQLKKEGYAPSYRKKEDRFFVTDGGNYIIDLHLGEIDESKALHQKLKLMTGVIDTGLFLDMTDLIIVGGDKEVHVIKK
ncbi:MAG TPA: ribose-5-phosphate isomerase RpiA [Bacteroidales bacterium]|nr:ribose-5-phosphate isomerase RpiA [Bacteroidales bacterium]